ncbi:ComEA family DNA-binding protein [Paenibacillus glycinis]|uniref:Helix-hairpin-helix DNA-binding motif class 1 domain-containing protein n=1 Tax=Paenibacillus glycinis TaxID=2697035 RepID=A0ABW9XJX0_9BACL|nr:ComEA family DNA-binding protein [Paenibacillus glycinis]NBD22905.1 hypothetical protein [Paenibacillus glycinis]
MLKRLMDRKRWSGMQLIAGLCIAVSIALLAAALLQKGSDDQPHWTAMNAQVDHALDSIEQGKADRQAQAGGKEADATKAAAAQKPAAGAKGAPAASATESDGAAQKPAVGTQDAPAAGAATGGTADEASTAVDATKGAAAETDGEPPSTPQSGASAADDPDTASSPSADGKIDVNHATSAELDALPGIGAAKAEAIVAERERGGPFRSADDLLRVKGIGPKLLDTMKSLIVLGP